MRFVARPPCSPGAIRMPKTRPLCGPGHADPEEECPEWGDLSMAGCASSSRTASGQLGVIAGCASLGAIRAPRTNARDSIQIGGPVRWMLGFMRAICARVVAVEARVGGVGI
jgi:hypothetical protein